MLIVARMNSRHTRIWFNINGDDDALDCKRIHKGLKSRGSAVSAPPQRECASRAGQPLTHVGTVGTHHRQAPGQTILLLLGQTGTHHRSS